MSNNVLVVALVAVSLVDFPPPVRPAAGASSGRPLRELALRRTAERVDDQLVTEMKSAVNDILYISEADYPFEIWKAPLAASEAVTPDIVKTKFSGQPGTDEEGVALKDLVGQILIHGCILGRFQLLQHLAGFVLLLFGRLLLVGTEHHHELQQFMFDFLQDRDELVHALRHEVLE